MFCFYSNSSGDCASFPLAGVQHYFNQVDGLKRIGIQEMMEKEGRVTAVGRSSNSWNAAGGLHVNKVLGTLKHLHKNLTNGGD